jgi:predicted RNA binding protein YcfA (HicA-like mRNA interferase family)
MPRRLNNWNYRQVKKFLEENNFKLVDVTGSHHYFSGMVENVPRMATVPFHGSKSIKQGTMKSIIVQSGISKEVWFNW